MFRWKEGKPEDRGIPQSAVDDLERLFERQAMGVLPRKQDGFGS